ncbi:MAG: PilZ domain-containing protein [Terriglobales bacterium]
METGKARKRRGRRIPMRLPVMIHWREPQGTWREVPAETRMLSRHGCLVSCEARIKLSDEVMVWWLERGRYTQARVVFRKVSSDEAVELALEFVGMDDFWQMDFSCSLPLRHSLPALTR